MYTLQEFRQLRARRLNIHLEAQALTTGFCEQLAAILAPYRVENQEAALDSRADLAPSGSVARARQAVGEANRRGCLIAARYRREDAEGCIIFGQQWTVAVKDDMLQRLRSEFGKRQISVQY